MPFRLLSDLATVSLADCLEPQPTLTLVAVYAGETLAVDEGTGNLCSGTSELTVNWGDACSEENITERTTNLKGVYGSTRDPIQHDSRDVETIFLSGIDIDGGTTAEFRNADATAPSVRFGCRARGAQPETLAGTATINREFRRQRPLGRPLGVLGTWSIAETAANGPDFKGSFGADLKPWPALRPQWTLPLAGGLWQRARPPCCCDTPARQCTPPPSGRSCPL